MCFAVTIANVKREHYMLSVTIANYWCRSIGELFYFILFYFLDTVHAKNLSNQKSREKKKVMILFYLGGRVQQPFGKLLSDT